MWDPEVELSSLIQDFTSHFYGAAGQYVKEYIMLLDNATLSSNAVMIGPASAMQYAFLTSDVLAKTQDLFNCAEKAVADSPELLLRVKQARMSADLAFLLFKSKYPALSTRAMCNAQNIADAYLQAYQKTVDQRPLKKQGKISEGSLDDKIKRYLAMHPVNPLPERFTQNSPEKIIQVTPENVEFQGKGGGFIQDEQAAAGIAATLSAEGELPFTYGYYDDIGETFVHNKEIKRDEIRSSGYAFYPIGRIAPVPRNYVWITKSWVMQIQLSFLAMVSVTGQEWDAYVSMRFEGPTFPFGEKGSTDKVFVDRLILVPVNGAQNKRN